MGGWGGGAADKCSVSVTLITPTSLLVNTVVSDARAANTFHIDQKDQFKSGITHIHTHHTPFEPISLCCHDGRQRFGTIHKMIYLVIINVVTLNGFRIQDSKDPKNNPQAQETQHCISK